MEDNLPPIATQPSPFQGWPQEPPQGRYDDPRHDDVLYRTEEKKPSPMKNRKAKIKARKQKKSP